MMKRLRETIAGLALAGMIGLGGGLAAPPAASKEVGSVYLLRGGLDIFSSGLNELGEKLRVQGIPARVEAYGNWREFVAEIAKRHKAGRNALPVVLMGHSWGADAVLLMAAELDELEVPVALVVTFDPLIQVKVTGNVGRVINFFSGGGAVPAEPAASFRGRLENVDVKELGRGLWHMNIEQDEGLHKRAISATLRAFD